MREQVNRFAEARLPGAVRVHGALARQEVFDLMKKARFLVFPSTCYESFPMAIAEAFACGLPVVSTDIGTPAEIVHAGRTGVFFRSGDPQSLAAAVDRLWARPAETRRMGGEARAEFLARYTAEANYARLMEIYSRARGGGGGRT